MVSISPLVFPSNQDQHTQKIHGTVFQYHIHSSSLSRHRDLLTKTKAKPKKTLQVLPHHCNNVGIFLVSLACRD